MAEVWTVENVTYIKQSPHQVVVNAEYNNGVTNEPFFDVLLTVHLSIILVINQLNAQILVL